MNATLFTEAAGPTALWIWLCVTVAVAVFATILYSIATFRNTSATLARHSLREFIWAIVPIAIVIATAAPALNHGSDIPAEASVLARQEPLAASCTSVPSLPATALPRLSVPCAVR